ncbi:MAG: type IV toxin-antitoxin system AbiEi family antitoxin domain-containing protein [Vulcanimicrobiaceae bacterium]
MGPGRGHALDADVESAFAPSLHRPERLDPVAPRVLGTTRQTVAASGRDRWRRSTGCDTILRQTASSLESRGPRIEDVLQELASEHERLFAVNEAAAAGVARALVVQLAHRGRLDRLAQRLYRFPIWPATGLQRYHEAVLWPRGRLPGPREPLGS